MSCLHVVYATARIVTLIVVTVGLSVVARAVARPVRHHVHHVQVVCPDGPVLPERHVRHVPFQSGPLLRDRPPARCGFDLHFCYRK